MYKVKNNRVFYGTSISSLYLGDTDAKDGEYEQRPTLIIPEQPKPSRDSVKAKLDRACHEYIIQGFTHDDKVYDFELENQVNMEAIKNNFALGFITEYDYYAKGEQCTTYTKDDFMALYSAGQEHKFGAIVKYKQLCAQVDATEDYESITW
jgi:hypothetical protein